MGNPYAPASQNKPNVYDSAQTSGPAPDPEVVIPGQEPEEETSAPTPPPTPEPGSDEGILVPPTGTIGEVIEWVEDDADRAQIALDAEKNGSNRKTLIASLESIISDGSN